MPVEFLRQLSGRDRSSRTNRQLGCVLCFVAGAMNAGGFLAVRQFTSHMTGLVSIMTDQIALGNATLALAGICALLAFVCGAATSAILINWGRRMHLHSQYAGPLMLEALLLLCFGLTGNTLTQDGAASVSQVVALLCFIMGLQNAIITKISRAEIRTTHVTGLVTDIGIELGKLLYQNTPSHRPGEPPVRADRAHLALLSALFGLFFVGGIAGTLAFKVYGYVATLPLAGLLLVISAVPVVDDVGLRVRRWRRAARSSMHDVP